MAEDLTTSLVDGAQSSEDERRLAGNVQDAIVVDPNASVDNPGGNSPVGAGVDNTITEKAPENLPPAVDVTADIPGPQTYDTGSSGDVIVPPQARAPLSESVAPQLAVLSNPIEQSLPEIPPAIPEELPPPAVTPPTAAVVPTPDELPPPTNEDLWDPIPNGGDPRNGLDQGQLAEQGLPKGSNPPTDEAYTPYILTDGELEFGDEQGLGQIETYIINGFGFSADRIQDLDNNPIVFYYDSETGTISLTAPGNGSIDGKMTLKEYVATDELNGIIRFDFEITNAVDNREGINSNITTETTKYPISLEVLSREADGSQSSSGEAEGFVIALDDIPRVVPAADADELHLDETISSTDDPKSGPNDILGVADPGIQSLTVNASQYFDPATTAGADLEVSRVYSFVLEPDGDDPIDSGIGSGFDGLIVIGGEKQIVPLLLFKDPSDPTIVFVSNDINGPRLIVFDLDPSTGELEVVLDTSEGSIWHDNPDLFDEPAFLDVTGGQFGLQLQITDGDGDVGSETYYFKDGDLSVDDDGPVLQQLTDTEVGEAITALEAAQEGDEEDSPTLFSLDESTVDEDPSAYDGDAGNPPGVRSDSEDLSSLFADAEYGADGAGTTTYSLRLSSDGLATGLYALDAGAEDGKGEEIYLFAVLDGGGNVTSIEGRVGENGAADPGGVVYFIIEVTDDVNGEVTFKQLEDGSGNVLAIWHDDTDRYDEFDALEVTDGTLELVKTVVDADGDTVEATADLSSGLFSIQDDGPVLQQLTDTEVGEAITALEAAQEGDEEDSPTLFSLDESTVDEDPSAYDGDAGNPPGVRSDSEDLSSLFADAEYGADGAGTTTYSLRLSSDGLATGLYALDAGAEDGKGEEIYLFAVLDGGGNVTSIEGRVGENGAADPGGVVYFIIEVTDDVNGEVTFKQLEDGSGNVLAIWHDDTDRYDEFDALEVTDGTLELVKTVVDADGDTVEATADLSSGLFSIQDDGPVLQQLTDTEVGEAITALEAAQEGDEEDSPTLFSLDESTVDEDPSAYDGDAGNPPGVRSDSEDLSSLFADAEYGADGAGTTTYSLRLSSDGLATGLYALDAGAEDGKGEEIYLFAVLDGGGNVTSIEGRVGENGAADPGGVVYFIIEVTDDVNGEVTFKQLEDGSGNVLAIWHDDTDRYDEFDALEVTDGTLELVKTVVDADGDTVEATADLSSGLFSIQDDGPVLQQLTDTEVGEAITALEAAQEGDEEDSPTLFSLDESTVDEDPSAYDGDAGNPPGVRSDSEDLSSLFADAEYGADGAGTTTYSLRLSSDGLATGLYALDAGAEDGKGEEIYLFAVLDGGGNVTSIEGRVGENGAADPGGVVYFIIEVTDDVNGEVTFKQLEDGSGNVLAIWHDDTDRYDEFDALEVTDGTLELVKTVVDADGDTVEATADLSSGLFSIQDDGPVLQQLTDTEVGEAITALEAAQEGDEEDSPTLFSLDESTVDEDPSAYDGDAGNPPGVRSDSEDLSSLFADAEYGADGAGTTTYSLRLSSDGLATGLYALDAGAEDGKGEEIYLFAVLDGGGNVTSIEGRVGENGAADPGGVVYFIIEVTDDVNGEVTFKQLEDGSGNVLAIWHDDTDRYDEFDALEVTDGTLELVKTVVDADGDTAEATADLSSGLFSIQDDGPVLQQLTDTEVGEAITALEAAQEGDEEDSPTLFSLDESTVDEDPSAYDGDAGNPPGVRSDSEDLSSLFADAEYGADGAGTTTYSLRLSSDGLATGLYALDAGAEDGKGEEIYLFAVLDGGGNVTSIEGRVGENGAADPGGVVYFIIEVTDDVNGEVTFKQLEDGSGNVLAIWHDDTDRYDEFDALEVTDGTLELVKTVVDADGDTAEATADLSSGLFSIQDDGPVLQQLTDTEVGEAITALEAAREGDEEDSPTLFSLDESTVDEDPSAYDGDAGNPPGVRSDSEDLSSLFADAEYGADGAGTTTYSLRLSSDGLATGLYALDAGAEDGKGEEIYLFAVLDGGGNVTSIEGRVGENGAADPGGVVYFIIEVTDDVNGEVTFKQLEDGSGNVLAIWHDDTDRYDEFDALEVTDGTLELVKTVVDADGDTVEATADLSSGLFSIQDDGPVLQQLTDTEVGEAITALEAAQEGDEEDSPTLFSLDESTVDEDPSAYDGDAGNPPGVRSDSEDLSSLFADAEYGADGAGTTTYSLRLSSDGLATGLYALDAGAEDGKGEEIYLFAVLDGGGNVTSIEGRVGENGAADPGGVVYFIIEVTDDVNGEVTFKQLEDGSGNVLAIWHDDTDRYDEFDALEVTDGTLELVKTVVDADGDTAEATADLSSGLFSIQDDGPSNLDVESLVVPRLYDPEEGTALDGDYSFSPGTDGPSDYSSYLITWDNIDSSIYTFSQDSDGLYSATYYDSDGNLLTYFQIHYTSGDNYEFALFNPPAPVIDSQDLFSGLALVNKLNNQEKAETAQATFDNFSLTIYAGNGSKGGPYSYSDGVGTNGPLLFYNNSNIGVNGQTMSSSDSIKLDVYDTLPGLTYTKLSIQLEPVGGANYSPTGQHQSLSATFYGLIDGITKSLTITNTSGSSYFAATSLVNQNGTLVYNVEFDLQAYIDDHSAYKGFVLDYIAFNTYDSTSVKIIGLSVGTELVEDPADNLLEFTATTFDSDGDSLSDSFTINVAAGDDDGNFIVTGSGDDSVTALAGDDTVFTDGGNDIVRGGEGDDILNTDGGQDIIGGGLGSDIMSGGAAGDQFVYYKGDSFQESSDVVKATDEIVDFTGGSDKIVFDGAKLMLLSGPDSQGVYSINVTWSDDTVEVFYIKSANAIVDDDLSSSLAAAPIAIDLDRSGSVDYSSTSAAVSSPWEGLVFSGLVGPSDGLLVYDSNNNRLIDLPEELVLTSWGSDPSVITDMEALATYFDSNHDGVFDSSDVAWQYFGVWQDQNSDGIQSDGEFYDLSHWGITSIALSYDADSHAYSTADGDVQVFGQMTVTYETADSAGSYTGLAEDMAFALQSSDPVVEASLPAASAEALDVQSLVSSYLGTMSTVGDSDGDGQYDASHGTGELAYHLDAVITDFMETQGLSDSDYAHIHQQVLDHLALDLNDVIPGTDHDLSFNDQGHVADDAAVLAALDQHFQEVLDLHNGVDEFAQHDIVVSDHMSV